MRTDNRDRLLTFFPATGDWVAVFPDFDVHTGADPFRLEAIIGWAVVTSWDDPAHTTIKAVFGGEAIEWDNDWIAVYPRKDLARPDVRAWIINLCESMRARRAPRAQ